MGLLRFISLRPVKEHNLGLQADMLDSYTKLFLLLTEA